MILITTSHRPSQRIRSFVKDLSSVIPYSIRVTRGKKTLEDLVIEAYKNGLSYIAIIGERRGNPSTIEIYKVDSSIMPPSAIRISTLLLSGVRLSRENPESIRVYNPRSVKVEYDQCVTDECFALADILLSITSKAFSHQPDVKIALEESEYVDVEFYSSTNHRIGPSLRIARVILYK
ncbi:Brix domain-containing protein [Desulfurococcus amylolyticus]|uniref:Brix domain-containing protein n=1 Tax=Desulfurococcus amylolyticus TaxID=94694 RepID=UPI0023F31B66|nr:ribosomal biogenesis protein [Desulfurococcus amylolyticus]